MLLSLRAQAERERRKRAALRPPPLNRREYVFRGSNLAFQSMTDMAVVLSGPAETGKTVAGLCHLHDICWTHPGAQCAIVRKVRDTLAGTVLLTFQEKVLLPSAGVKVYGANNPEKYIYPNGSVIWLGGMDKAGKALSSERDAIYVNQAEELSLPDWETLTTRTTGRAGHVPSPQILGDCNPESPTHWLLAKKKTGALKLLETTHKDNPNLYHEDGTLTEQGIRSLSVLAQLTGARKKRLFEGLWASPEGAIYDVFDKERHSLPSFPVPHLWPRFVGIDPVGAYVCALFAAFDPASGILHVYREYYGEYGATTPGHVRAILDLCKDETIFAWVGGGPSERQARLDWNNAGIPLIEPPISDVWSGIDKVYQLMADFKLVIHDCCINLLSEIGSYVRAMKDGVVTDTIEHKERFHAADSLRYLCAFLCEPTEQGQVVYAPVQIGPSY